MEKILELEINENLPTVKKINPYTYRINLDDLVGWKKVALYKMSLPYLFKNITNENNSFYISLNISGEEKGYIIRLDPGYYDYEDLGLEIMRKLKEAVKEPGFVLPDDAIKISLNGLTVKTEIRARSDTVKIIGLNLLIARMLGYTQKDVGNFVFLLSTSTLKYTIHASDITPDITDKTALIITNINWVRKQYSNYEALTDSVLSVESLSNYLLGGMIKVDNTGKLIWLRMLPGVKNNIEVSFSTGEKYLELEPDLTVNLTLILSKV